MSDKDTRAMNRRNGTAMIPGEFPISSPERDDPQVLIREVPLEIAEGDGRTIEARIIPYGETATICDPPDYIVQQERFAPGAFDKQINAAHRVKVWLSTLHEQGLRGIIGHGETLEDRDDGVYASFRVHENADGEKALMMVREGLLPSMSVEFLDLQPTPVRNGIVERVRCHLDRVSLVPVGAYEGAKVLALREPVLSFPRPAPLPAELLNDLRSHGIKIEDTSDPPE